MALTAQSQSHLQSNRLKNRGKKSLKAPFSLPLEMTYVGRET